VRVITRKYLALKQAISPAGGIPVGDRNCKPLNSWFPEEVWAMAIVVRGKTPGIRIDSRCPGAVLVIAMTSGLCYFSVPCGLSQKRLTGMVECSQKERQSPALNAGKDKNYIQIELYYLKTKNSGCLERGLVDGTIWFWTGFH